MTEPRFPQYVARPEPQYPLSVQAEARQHRSKARQHLDLIIAVLCAVAIVAVVSAVVYRDWTATRAADAAPVVAKPTATPGVPVPQRTKPVEQSPKISEVVPGDGTWLIGREIKRGTYATEGGPTCYWARLANLSGELVAVVQNGGFNGPQKVALSPGDVAFSSQGCGQWVMVP